MVARYVNDLAVQLAKKDIRINAVHPTNVNTDMLHNEGMYRVFRPDLEHPTREEAEMAFPAMQAMRVPYIEPSDVSEAVLFLASDASRFITGTQLRIDAGGYVKSVPGRMNTTMTDIIGFLGAGQMGEPMVRRLLGAGHDVRIYARRKRCACVSALRVRTSPTRSRMWLGRPTFSLCACSRMRS